MVEKLDKRVAIITGASRGIGEASAYALAEQGRHVVLSSRSGKKLEQVKDRIIDSGGSACVRTCDVSDGEALEAMVEGVGEEFGRIDILVNNAGMTRDGLLLRMSDEQFDEVINLNLRSVFIATRTAIRYMMRGKWGRIISVSSVSGVIGNQGQSNYAASKAGVIGFSKSIAKEMASKGITANVVAPGFIETEMTDVLADPIKQYAKGMIPLKKFGKPEDIAAAVAYFASEQAEYCTGQTLSVDGGMTMI